MGRGKGGQSRGSAKVQRCKGGRERSSLVGEGARGPVDWWERDEQEMQCKCAKVNVSGLVGEWTSGLGREDAVPLKLD